MGIKGYTPEYHNDGLIERDNEIISRYVLYIEALEARSKMLLDAFVSCREDEMEYMKAAKDAFKEIDELTDENERLKRENKKLKSEIVKLWHRDKAIENVNVDLISDNTELYSAIMEVYTRVKEIVTSD